LIVDDNPADQDLAREALHDKARRGQIDTAGDGEEALEVLHKRGAYEGKTRPDLVILDLKLPKKDGLTVLAEMKADPDLRDIPVIIFSSSSLTEDICRSYRLGANCYVTKPGSLDEYLATLKAIEKYWFGVSRLPEGKA
jgi:CheY-like chemotaxis protein